MAAYVIGTVMIHDPSWVEEYGPAVKSMVEAHGGKYLIRDLEAHHLEGDGPVPPAIVVLEFPSTEQARNWYHSPEYQPYIKLRQAGATGDLFLVSGL